MHYCHCFYPTIAYVNNGKDKYCTNCKKWWSKEYGSYEPGTVPRLRAFRLGRNDPCPCGSGKKYKKCHLGKFKE